MKTVWKCFDLKLILHFHHPSTIAIWQNFNSANLFRIVNYN